MRSGCLSLVMRIGVVAAAAVLAALSMAIILSFGISALGQPEGLERIFKVVIATAAGFAFFLVGRAVWRDLRKSAEPEQTSTREPRR